MKWGISLLCDSQQNTTVKSFRKNQRCSPHVKSPSQVNLLCVLTFIWHCTALPKDWGSMKWGNSLLNTQYIFSQRPPQSYQTPKHPHSIVFPLE